MSAEEKTNGGKGKPLPKRSAGRQEEMRWLAEHHDEIHEKYPGEWLALDGSRLLAHGEDLHEVRRLAQEAGVDNPFFDAVTSKEWQGEIVIRSPRFIAQWR
jgi:hypothetical protein